MGNCLMSFKHKEFGSMRIIMIDNVPWFVTEDIISILQYKTDLTKYLNHFILDNCKGVATCTVNGKTEQFSVINKQGVYGLVFGTDNPDALEIHQWISTTVANIKKINKNVDTKPSLPPNIYCLKIGDNVWFRAKEIANLLNYENSLQAIENYVDAADKQIISNNEDVTESLIINENGVRSLVDNSDSPNALAIQEWIHNDVLNLLGETDSGQLFFKEDEKSAVNIEVNNMDNIDNLVPIEQNGQRVLLTSQLADAYETTTDCIIKNFNRNKDRYHEGKHYFMLSGESLKGFKETIGQIVPYSKYTSRLLLWTEQGALLHAKSLNTDKAWEAYEKLVEYYFRVNVIMNDISSLSPQLQALINLELEQKKQAKALKDMDNKIENIRNIVSVRPISWREDCNRLINAIAETRQDRDGFENMYQKTKNEVYCAVDKRAGVSLQTRLKNQRNRLFKAGYSISKVNALNKLDIIAQEKKLIEIYILIVKEMCVKYNVDISSII